MWEWLNFGYDDKKESSSEFKECSKTCSKEYNKEEPPKTAQEEPTKPTQEEPPKSVQEEPPKSHISSSPWLLERDVNVCDKGGSSAICMYNQFEWLLASKPPTPLPQITTSDHEKKIERKDVKTEKISTLEVKTEPSKEEVILAKPEHRKKSTSSPPPSPQKSPCKRKKASTYFPRFIMTVLEALRDLKQQDEADEGHSFRAIIRYVKENFIVDGDVEAQVKTALRLAHVSGLVVYLTCYRSYRLTTTTIGDMGVSKKRYERFLRRRRAVGNIDPTELHNTPRNCNTAVCDTSLCEKPGKPSSEDKETNS